MATESHDSDTRAGPYQSRSWVQHVTTAHTIPLCIEYELKIFEHGRNHAKPKHVYRKAILFFTSREHRASVPKQYMAFHDQFDSNYRINCRDCLSWPEQLLTEDGVPDYRILFRDIYEKHKRQDGSTDGSEDEFEYLRSDASPGPVRFSSVKPLKDAASERKRTSSERGHRRRGSEFSSASVDEEHAESNTRGYGSPSYAPEAGSEFKPGENDSIGSIFLEESDFREGGLSAGASPRENRTLQRPRAVKPNPSTRAPEPSGRAGEPVQGPYTNGYGEDCEEGTYPDHAPRDKDTCTEKGANVFPGRVLKWADDIAQKLNFSENRFFSTLVCIFIHYGAETQHTVNKAYLTDELATLMTISMLASMISTGGTAADYIEAIYEQWEDLDMLCNVMVMTDAIVRGMFKLNFLSDDLVSRLSIREGCERVELFETVDDLFHPPDEVVRRRRVRNQEWASEKAYRMKKKSREEASSTDADGKKKKKKPKTREHESREIRKAKERKKTKRSRRYRRKHTSSDTGSSGTSSSVEERADRRRHNRRK